MSPPRRVVLVCGPPGAGKTTHARSLGLPVFDIDDDRWEGSERLFRSALRELARNPEARAVVIRSGATRAARSAAAAMVGATEIRVIETPAEVCVERVIARNRPRPPMRVQIAAVGSWWERYEPDAEAFLGATSREW